MPEGDPNVASPTLVSPNGTVRLEVSDGVCWITLNRPDSLNAITENMAQALLEITEGLKTETDVKCVVLRGSGAHFMAGGDVKGFKSVIDEADSQDVVSNFFARLLERIHATTENLRALPQPVIAGVHGAVAGVGVSLMLAADLVIASEDAFFTLAYNQLGTSPDGGSTYFLPRVVGMKKAFELTLLGERFSAKEAYHMGLLNRVVELGDFYGALDTMARHIAEGPSRAHAEAKMLLNGSLQRGLTDQLEAETAAFLRASRTRDFREGITAFTEKRKPVFRGD